MLDYLVNLVLHLTHRGASWASGAAQAAQFVRIILRFAVILGLRRLTRLEKPDFFQLTKRRRATRTLYRRPANAK